MKNYNTGCVLEYNDFIHDKKEAAKQFAEGSKDLEDLLNFCFDNGIITKACCIGHKTEEYESLPYIAFAFCKNNEIYFQSLLYYLKDSEYEIDYLKNENGTSFIAFYENKNFNFNEPTNLFKNILLILQKTNLRQNYFELLPNDLKNFYLFCLYSEIDSHLHVGNVDEYHSIRRTKNNNGHCYHIVTTNRKYKKYMRKCQLKQKNIDSFEIFHKNREIVGLKLQMVNTYISNIISCLALPNYLLNDSSEKQKILQK